MSQALQAAPAPLSAVQRNFPSDTEWRMIMQTASHVWKSGMADSYGIKAESAIVLVMLKGWELGLPLMGSLEHIRVIHGRVSVSAECQQALVLSRVSGARFRWVADGRNGVAEVIAVRPGHVDVTAKYTMEDAERGGVAGRNPTYRTWPANLLRAGAMRNVCRSQFPDVILGMTGFDESDVVDEPSEPVPATRVAMAPPPVPAALPKREPEPAALPEGPRLPTMTMPAPPPVEHEPQREPGDDSAQEPPPDYPLPFEDGRYAGKNLSDLADVREFRLMLNGFNKAAAEAEKNGDHERKTDRLGWADLVVSWAAYRGFDDVSAAR